MAEKGQAASAGNLSDCCSGTQSASSVWREMTERRLLCRSCGGQDPGKAGSAIAEGGCPTREAHDQSERMPCAKHFFF